jgi:hypothetical protein
MSEFESELTVITDWERIKDEEKLSDGRVIASLKDGQMLTPGFKKLKERLCAK